MHLSEQLYSIFCVLLVTYVGAYSPVIRTPVTFPSTMSMPSTVPWTRVTPFEMAASINLVVSSSGVTCAVFVPVKCIRCLISIVTLFTLITTSEDNYKISQSRSEIIMRFEQFCMQFRRIRIIINYWLHASLQYCHCLASGHLLSNEESLTGFHNI